MQTDRKLVVTENMTVDGVIDAAEGWFSPAGEEDGVDSSDLEATLREHMEAQDALLLGRATFESVREYWPKQSDDTTGITAHLRLFVHPTMIGHGRRLFEDEVSRPKLQLVDTKSFRSDVVLLTYRAV
jgi:dihydrofolate reductase